MSQKGTQCVLKNPEVLDKVTKHFPSFDKNFLKIPSYNSGVNIGKNVRECVQKLATLHALGFAYNALDNPKLDQVAKSIFFDNGSLGNKYIQTDVHRRLQNPKFKKTLCLDGLTSNEDPKRFSLVVAPPVYNMLQGIFNGTNEDSRQKFYTVLINLYYDSLKKNLLKLNLEVRDFLPFEDLELGLHSFLPIVKLELALSQKTDKVDDLWASFNSLIVKEDCYSIIQNSIAPEQYQFTGFSLLPFGQVGGYLGDYHKLKIQIEENSKNTEINCFVKTLPTSSSAHNVVVESGCFFKEVFFYKTLVQQMLELGLSRITSCVPKSYFQRPEQLIVFEDLGLEGFSTQSPKIPYNFKLLALVAQKVAKYHASILAFEERKSRLLNKKYRLDHDYASYTKEVFFLRDQFDSCARLMQAGVKAIPDVLDLFPQTRENQVEYSAAWSIIEDRVFEANKTSTKYRNVFCHGDLWSSNIMIKFEGNEPTDCRFVDFQYTRKQYEEQIKKLYHETLARELQNYGLDVEEIYSWADFLESYEYQKPAMVLQTVFYYNFILCVGDDISSTLADEAKTEELFFGNRKEHLREMCAKSDIFKERLGESVVDFYDTCHLIANQKSY